MKKENPRFIKDMISQARQVKEVKKEVLKPAEKVKVPVPKAQKKEVVQFTQQDTDLLNKCNEIIGSYYNEFWMVSYAIYQIESKNLYKIEKDTDGQPYKSCRDYISAKFSISHKHFYNLLNFFNANVLIEDKSPDSITENEVKEIKPQLNLLTVENIPKSLMDDKDKLKKFKKIAEEEAKHNARNKGIITGKNAKQAVKKILNIKTESPKSKINSQLAKMSRDLNALLKDGKNLKSSNCLEKLKSIKGTALLLIEIIEKEETVTILPKSLSLRREKSNIIFSPKKKAKRK